MILIRQNKVLLNKRNALIPSLLKISLLPFVTITMFYFVKNMLKVSKMDTLNGKLKELLELEELKRGQISAMCSQLMSWDMYDETLMRICFGDDRTTFYKPLLLTQLPHLASNWSFIQPHVLYSKKKPNVTIVIGIVTVRRSNYQYIEETLTSLIENLNEEEMEKTQIVVMITELKERSRYVEQVEKLITAKFMKHLSSGLLQVLASNPDFYPDLNSIEVTLGDPKERAMWRTKQNLDYIYLMMYCWGKGRYYLQLEDDVITTGNYITEIEKRVEPLKTVSKTGKEYEDWFMVQFSKMGFIGKLFNKDSLLLMIEFLLMFYQDKPCDWLVDHVVGTMETCVPLSENSSCPGSQPFKKRITISPSLFQHIGLHSSLAGKIQNIKARDFHHKVALLSSQNPPATVHTTLNKIKNHPHELQQVYDFKSPDQSFFFWAWGPRSDDVITIKFTNPLPLRSYEIRCGTMEYPNDILHNVTVLVQFHDDAVAKDKEKFVSMDNVNVRENGRILLGDLSRNINQSVHAIRILFLSDSSYWLAIKEIIITTFGSNKTINNNNNTKHNNKNNDNNNNIKINNNNNINDVIRFCNYANINETFCSRWIVFRLSVTPNPIIDSIHNPRHKKLSLKRKIYDLFWRDFAIVDVILCLSVVAWSKRSRLLRLGFLGTMNLRMSLNNGGCISGRNVTTFLHLFFPETE
ncbi:hypothetical protein HELRODRAFT_190605 [Helobdella robusta]|uniref:Alpha-1,3-mannosyl-glycoprotein 4-beta-N-acetylglucosaminyltransferase B n=1 Tax=Helobdella robusta TaxID=6412 RepID=T1FS45_HELRO|nr:hypothetical protein HELRODRAFT_190605 [Helobdella robusta]ESO08788.1 hypothetical protein HELRODRAFT_190605 [Helobdella robusta]